MVISLTQRICSDFSLTEICSFLGYFDDLSISFRDFLNGNSHDDDYYYGNEEYTGKY